MQNAPLSYKKLVLVCVNERTGGRECCANRDSQFLYEKLKEKLAGVDPRVRVSKTGCLGHCSSGPTVVIQPDNRWLVGVTMSDIDTIVEMATSDVGEDPLASLF